MKASLKDRHRGKRALSSSLQADPPRHLLCLSMEMLVLKCTRDESRLNLTKRGSDCKSKIYLQADTEE